jgi:ABC-type multidrug transport system fused ATPase/permease subunit
MTNANLIAAAPDLLEALEIAQLSDLVEALTGGLDSILEENGESLSGGQRQRMGIARALYTKPSVIVFDEATSALDAETESLVGEAILNLKESSTVIIIAHRLSTAKNADVVCYLESGKILAVGTFQEVRKSVPHGMSSRSCGATAGTRCWLKTPAASCAASWKAPSMVSSRRLKPRVAPTRVNTSLASILNSRHWLHT